MTFSNLETLVEGYLIPFSSHRDFICEFLESYGLKEADDTKGQRYNKFYTIILVPNRPKAGSSYWYTRPYEGDEERGYITVNLYEIAQVLNENVGK